MVLALTKIFIIVCFIYVTKGLEYEEDKRNLVKRQVDYYNYVEETTQPPSTRKIIRKCPTNSLGKIVRCKKKKKRKTTTPISFIPPSWIRSGALGIQPISMFVGKDFFNLGNSSTTTTLSTSTTKSSESSTAGLISRMGAALPLAPVSSILLPTGTPGSSTSTSSTTTRNSTTSSTETSSNNENIMGFPSSFNRAVPMRPFPTTTTVKNPSPVVVSTTATDTTTSFPTTRTTTVSSLVKSPIGAPAILLPIFRDNLFTVKPTASATTSVNNPLNSATSSIPGTVPSTPASNPSSLIISSLSPTTSLSFSTTAALKVITNSAIPTTTVTSLTTIKNEESFVETSTLRLTGKIKENLTTISMTGSVKPVNSKKSTKSKSKKRTKKPKKNQKRKTSKKSGSKSTTKSN